MEAIILTPDSNGVCGEPTVVSIGGKVADESGLSVKMKTDSTGRMVRDAKAEPAIVARG